MKVFNRIGKFLNRLPRRTAASLVAVLMLTSIAAPIALTSISHAEFSPNRPTYDYNKPPLNGTSCTPADDADRNRCGSLSGPVFNSFINTPEYGDERSFADARRSDQNQAGAWKDQVNDVVDGPKEVVIRLYVHNNANENTNASGVGIARNTKVRVDLPEGSSAAHRARGYISASNATSVQDSVDFVAPSNMPFSMDYVEGSARLVDGDNFANGVALSDSIVTDAGAQIGSDSINGDFKGCFPSQALVYITVKIIPIAPDVDLTKQVSRVGGVWSEVANFAPGETVRWLIHYKNTGNVEHTNVLISDAMPKHMKVVPGSVKIITTAGEDGQNDTSFFTTGGFNMSTGGWKWHPGDGFYVRFDTIAQSDFTGCSVRVRNIVFNDTDQTDKIEDTADAIITKQNCAPTPTPTQPTQLPVTGPGDMIAIFVATSVAGTMVYRVVLSRRYF